MKKKFGHRFLVSLACSAMSVALAAGNAAAVYAADAPAPIQSTYEIDDVIYFDAGSDAFSSYPEEYLSDMLTNKSSQLGGSSIADLWLDTAVGICFHKKNSRFQILVPAMYQALASESGKANVSDVSGFRVIMQPTTSLKQAEYLFMRNVVTRGGELEDSAGQGLIEMGVQSALSKQGVFQSEESAQPQTIYIAGVAAVSDSNSNLNSEIAVYFSDFEIIPILPRDEGDNYVTEVLKDEKKSGEVVASNVKNLTGTTVEATQNLDHSYSYAMSSGIEGSRQYTFGQSIKYGFNYGFDLDTAGYKWENSVEIEFSAEEAISKGWSESSEVTKEDSNSSSVSIEMPPYTNVMLSQEKRATELLTKYNCPVGLKYKATIVSYTAPDVSTVKYPNLTREDIKKWAVDLPNNTNSYEIDFAKVNSEYPEAKNAEKLIAKHVPMSSTGGSYSLSLNTTSSEVSGLMPIYPLAKVKLAAPEGISIGSNYATLEYLRMPMKVGTHDYTNKFELEALNTLDYDYYGFSKDYGHWEVADENGDPWTDADTCPVTISGRRFTAVRPGQCFLKYVIDEDAYDCATSLGKYTKNEDLLETAMIEIDVSLDGSEEPPVEKSTIEVNGSFTGYVGEDAAALDQENGLSVMVCDPSGKEIEAEYTWEKKEADGKGFTLDENGKATFAKAGTFHVRAVCESLGIQSDWKEITAVNRTYDVTFHPQNGDNTIVSTTLAGSAISAPSVKAGTCKAFAGWFTDAACTKKADLTQPVTKNMTLYAGWTDAHNLQEVKAVAATCESDGTAAHFVCKTCKKLFADADATKEITAKETVIAGGHKMTKTKRKAATCTKAGNIEYYTCSACGGYFTDKKGMEELSEGDLAIAAAGHSWDDGEITTAPTCEKTGVKTYTCLSCEKTKTEKVKALGHDWTEWKTVKEATEQEEGQQMRSCLNDPSHTETRKVPVLSHVHTLVKTKKKAPTCTKEGNILYYTCSGCGWVFTDAAATKEIAPEDTVLEATGHTWDEGKVTKEPTCTEKGEKTITCQGCQKTKKEVLNALGHDWDNGTVTKEATCTEKGIETITCRNCEETKRKFQKALGHDWDEGKITIESTCKKKGVKTFTCSLCGGTKTKKVKALGHDWDDGKITKAPTCTAKGVKTFTCETCGKKKTKKLKALGHDWGEWQVQRAATTRKKGIEVCYCQNNKKHVKKRTIAKLEPELKTGQFIRASMSSIQKSSLTVSWSGAEGAARYLIYVGECGDGYTDTYKANAETGLLKLRKVLGKKLQPGTFYKLFVVAYGEDDDGKQQEIGRSPVLHVITKGSAKYSNFTDLKLKSQKTLTLKKGGTGTVSAVQSISSRTKTVPIHRGVYYYSSDSSVASVARKTGKVTAKKAGTCKIYCVSQNGLYQEVTVKVK